MGVWPARQGRASVPRVLLLLPPSEAKNAPPRDGPPVDLGGLSFPALAATRARVLTALVETSARPDALRRLMVGGSLADEVERNTRLASLPARPVLDVYAGPLFEALGASTLSAAAQRRAADDVVVVSALWGAVRPTDRIPAYRLNVCAHLVGMPALEPLWREVLGPVLAEAAGPQGVVVDLRASSYQAVGMPRGLGDRTVTLRVLRDADERRTAGPHVGKVTRGAVARHLLERDADPRTAEDLAEVLSERWSARVDAAPRAGKPWTVEVVAAAG